MSDIPQIFADGIANINVQNGAVRIDHFSLKPGDTDGTNRQISHRTVMSTEGFLQAFASMEKVVNQLIERGVISRRTQENEDTVSAEE